MSKASKLLRNIDERRRAARRKAEEIEIYDPDDTSFFTVRADSLWWLLSRKLIDRCDYFAGRELQGLYLTAQIQPPRCTLGRNLSGGRGYAIAENQYPNNEAFYCLKKLAWVRKRLRPSSWHILENAICRYWADDDVSRGGHKKFITRHADKIAFALTDLAWAIGFSTETIYAKEKRNEYLRNREILRRERG